MAGTNTEKPTGKAESKSMVAPKTPKKVKSEVAKTLIKKETEKKVEVTNKSKEIKKEEKKPVVKKIKKTKAFVNLENVQTSTKYSVAICRFIKNKSINKAIKDLEQVIVLKKAVPMKGEIPHRKGKIMSGRFPARAAKEFILALKSLQGNCNNCDLEEPIIHEAIANKGSTVYGRMGRHQKKRTHLKIVAKEKKLIKKEKNIK